jgi:hypothetical protein
LTLIHAALAEFTRIASITASAAPTVHAKKEDGLMVILLCAIPGKRMVLSHAAHNVFFL